MISPKACPNGLISVPYKNRKIHLIYSGAISDKLLISASAVRGTLLNGAHIFRNIILIQSTDMKILSLNTWGGRAGKDKLLGFFEKHNHEIGVFCLQEIWSSPYQHLDGHLAGGMSIDHKNIMVYGKQDISKTLPDYQVYFHPHHLDNYGLMMLVRRDLKVIENGEIFVYKHKGYLPKGDVGNHARNIQYVNIKTDKGLITIINFHGLWNGRG